MDLWLAVFLALLAGAALAWVLATAFGRARESSLRAQLEAATGQLTETRAQIDALRAATERARTEVAERDAKVASAAATLDAERKSAAEKLAALQDVQARLTDSFKALSADALRSNNENFLKLAQAALGQFQEGARGDLEKRQQAIDSLVTPLRESLAKVETKIGEIEQTRGSAYSALSEQLKGLAGAQAALQMETTRLSTALSTTRTAGTWGELQLRRVVELAGMVEHCDFTEQEVVAGQRPDLVVKLPQNQQIVVDAKAPTDAYREAASATDPAIRAAKLIEHAAKVRLHVEALSSRSYWEQFQPSPEFVVLFLPGDQFLSAALEGDPALLDRAIRSRVLLATPSTLVALLKASAYGWRQEAVSRNSEEIARLGRELYDRVVNFAEHLEKTGRSLDQATRSYNAAVGSFEGTLLPGARKFVELGAKGAKELPDPGPVETTARDVTKRA